MATDDNGGNPTDLSGVTFIGRPETGQSSFHIRRGSGKILGPFDAELIGQMIRGGKLSGDEAVSPDRERWNPIMSIPMFAEAFPEGSTTKRTQIGLASIGDPIPRTAIDPVDTSMGSPGTGGFQALDDSDILTEESYAGPAPGGDALSNVPGIRRMSPEQPSELPMPEGFTNFPLGDDAPSFSLPQSELPASPAPGNPSPTMDVGMGGGATIEMPADDLGWSAAPGTGQPTIEQTGFDLPTNLPTSAGGVSDLPASAEGHAELPTSLTGLSDLPVSANPHGNLPQSAAGLPQSAAGLPQSAAGLPQSAAGLPQSAAGLPQTAAGLPTSASDLPISAGSSQFGTMAMSGLDVDGPGPGGDLPASARAAGTSVLDTMAQTDDIWATPEDGVGGRTSVGQGRASDDSGFGGFDPPPSQDPFGTAGAEDDFADFFPGAEAEQVAPPPEYDADPVAEEQEAFEPPPPPSRTKKSAASSWGLRIGLLIVLLAVLGGAAFLLKSIAKPQEDETPVAVAPIEPRPVTVAELPPITTLDDGGYPTLVDFVDTARTVVGDRGTAEDRAAFLMAGSLLFTGHPNHADLLPELQRTYAALADADDEGVEDPGLVTTARAAYLAAVGSDEAPAAIDAAIAGPMAGWGHFAAGMYEIQRFRGVQVEAEEEEAPEEADEDPALEEGFEANDDDEAGDEEGETETAEEGGDEAVDAPAGDEAVDEEVEEEAPVVAEAPELSPETAAHFDAAISAAPDFAPAHYWRGWVALHTGDAEAAEQHFTATLELNAEHVDADIGVARSLMMQAKLSDADARIQQVITQFATVSSDHQRADTFVAAAEIAAARMRPETAIESLLSALQAEPANVDALRMLATQFFRAEQFVRALEFYETFEDASEDGEAEVAIGKAMAQYGLEEWAEAREVLEPALEQFPRDGRFPYWLGRTYEHDAEFELARQYYRQAMQTEPHNVLPLVRLAQLAQRENKETEALTFLDQATETNRGDATMANEIGEMYFTLGAANRAVTAYLMALEMDGSQPDARINLTEYYLDSGQQERAVEQLSIMLASGVESPRLRYLHARALHGMGDHQRAIEELLVLQEADADNAEYLLLLGKVHFDAGNHTSAREHFVRALAADPTLVEAQYYVGRCDIELGGYNEAITSLTGATHRAVRGEYHYWLGVALERAEQPAQALSEFDRAIDVDIAWSLENPDVFNRRGRLFFARGAMGSAYHDLRTVLTLRPRHADASWTLGRVQYDERDYAKSVETFEYSIGLDDQRPEVNYYAALAYLRLEPPQPDAARRHFEAAREAGYGEEQPELLQKLAYVYRDLGDRTRAVQMLEEFLEVAALPYDEQRETENEIRTLRGR